MDFSRIRRGEPGDLLEGRRADDQITHGARQAVGHATGVPPDREATEGQLGPDELSEPEEVVMNLEAKRHH